MRRWLTFDTVEVNATFYRLPSPETFAAWVADTPVDFVMAVKASRYLTHLKRLRDPEEPVQRLFDHAAALGSRLGPVLYQLPGNFRRDPSWYVDETFDLLADRGVGLCLHDKHGSAIDTPVVGPLLYARFHGTSGRYYGSYEAEALERWATRLADQWKAGRDVYVYFNNDPEAVAPHNALTLRELVLARI